MNIQKLGQNRSNRSAQRRVAAKSAGPVSQHASVQTSQAQVNPKSASPESLLALQGQIGNRGVQRMLANHTIQPKLTVGPAADAYEQEADQVSLSVMRSFHSMDTQTGSNARPSPSNSPDTPQAPLVQRRVVPATQETSVESGAGFDVNAGWESKLNASGGAGSPLPNNTRSSMESRFGADFSRVRVHTNSQAIQLNRDIQSQAFTHGSNIFFDQGKYDPGSKTGQHLLAHELTHVVQQNSAGVVKRKLGTGNIEVRGHLAPNRISTKRRKMKLDFVRMKRRDAHIGKIIKSYLGVIPRVRDTYGHWWTELGALSASDQWAAESSYGWWPSVKVNTKQTLKGVPGQLNKGETNDPHHGQGANEVFHPTMMVDDQADYDTVKNDVIGKIRSFATGFKGSWNWRLGWGKNCHTFQQNMKKAVHLHNQKSNRWLRDPKIVAAKQQAEQDAENQRTAQQNADFPQPTQFEPVTTFLDRYQRDDKGVMKPAGMLRPNEYTIGITGKIENGYVQFTMGDGANRGWFWARANEYQNAMGKPYPGTEQPVLNDPAMDNDTGVGGGDAVDTDTGGGGDSDNQTVPEVDITNGLPDMQNGQDATQTVDTQPQTPGYTPPAPNSVETLKYDLNFMVNPAYGVGRPEPKVAPAGSNIMILGVPTPDGKIEFEVERVGRGIANLIDLQRALEGVTLPDQI